MKNKGHIIKKVLPGGIAEEMGVEPGMAVIAVNGHEIEDVFDYRYYMMAEHVDVLIREESGEETVLEIDKDPDEEFGVEFESSLMDDYKRCSNNCIFCFVDQMPKGMRPTLYFKDDDSRLSFLQGNYITLTNMKDRDIDRIIDFRMEPINISVHTTNPELRAKMLGNRFAGKIFPKMRRLADAGIEMNGQIVLCRNWNDGAELERTIGDLVTYRPALRSVSVVPVGLSRYREGLCHLDPFDAESAGAVIDTIEAWQKKLIAEDPDAEFPHFIHASDEWYLLAGRPLPPEDQYDGYPQLENGVGMLRLLENEVISELRTPHRLKYSPRTITMATGLLAGPYIREYAGLIEAQHKNLHVHVALIRNDFFGELITVSGLITAGDLIRQILEIPAEERGEELLIPVNMLRSGEQVFLDDLTVSDVEKALSMKVRVVRASGRSFVRSVLGLAEEKAGKRQVYEGAGQY